MTGLNTKLQSLSKITDLNNGTLAGINCIPIG